MSKRKFILTLLTCVLSLFLFGSGLPALASESPERTLNGKSAPVVAVWDVGTYADLLEEYLPTSSIVYYYTSAEMALAVRQNKADAMVIGRSYYDYFIDDFEGLKPIDDVIGTCEKAIIFSNDDIGATRLNQANEFIAKCHEDGTLDRLAKKWFSPDNEDQTIDFSVMDPNGETLIFGTDQSEPPYCLLKDEQLVGYDLEFMVLFCAEYGYNLEIHDDGYDAITAGIQTGKYDVVGAGFEVEEEREEVVNFTDSMYTDDVIILVPDEKESLGFFENIKNNFEKTFMREGRYKLFVAGIGRTLLMFILSAILGTFLGFGLYFLNRDGGKIFKGIISAYVTILKLVPILVILMMIYYIIFGDTRINGVWVAVITFTMIFGASVFEILDSGIDTVERGQSEAAYTLGFSKNRTFFKILLPQSAKYILPMYKDELIKLVEETSIVGYIAIQDLTRISDVVRAQTFEPFFPLIMTALVYILIAVLIILCINLFYKKINTKNRPKEKILKGIRLNDTNKPS